MPTKLTGQTNRQTRQRLHATPLREHNNEMANNVNPDQTLSRAVHYLLGLRVFNSFLHEYSC